MTQTEKVLELLEQAGTRGVTPLDALEFVGSFRLGARIWDLRAAGVDIETKWVRTAGGARVACYVLVQPEQETLGL